MRAYVHGHVYFRERPNSSWHDAGKMTLTRRIAQPETNRMPLEPRQANRPEDFQRSIRPRPLHVDDQVQLVVLPLDCILESGHHTCTPFQCCQSLCCIWRSGQAMMSK